MAEKRRYLKPVEIGVFRVEADRTVYRREESGALVKVEDEAFAEEVYQAALAKQAAEGKRVPLPAVSD